MEEVKSKLRPEREVGLSQVKMEERGSYARNMTCSGNCISVLLDANCDEKGCRGKPEPGHTGPYNPWGGSEE